MTSLTTAKQRLASGASGLLAVRIKSIDVTIVRIGKSVRPFDFFGEPDVLGGTESGRYFIIRFVTAT